MLPKLQEKYKILSNVPTKQEDLIKSFENLGVLNDPDEVGPLALFSVAFNEKFIDTINRPVSKYHQKVRDLQIQIVKARKISEIKEKKKRVLERMGYIKSIDENKEAVDEGTKFYHQFVEIDKKIAQADDKSVMFRFLFQLIVHFLYIFRILFCVWHVRV